MYVVIEELGSDEEAQWVFVRKVWNRSSENLAETGLTSSDDLLRAAANRCRSARGERRTVQTPNGANAERCKRRTV
jgi:hypothetical protein